MTGGRAGPDGQARPFTAKFQVDADEDWEAMRLGDDDGDDGEMMMMMIDAAEEVRRDAMAVGLTVR